MLNSCLVSQLKIKIYILFTIINENAFFLKIKFALNKDFFLDKCIPGGGMYMTPNGLKPSMDQK